MKSLLTTKLVISGVFASLLAALAVGAAFCWHEVQSCRNEQRSYLLSQAFAAASEVRLALDQQKRMELPSQMSAGTEARLRQRIAANHGADSLETIGLVVEVLRHLSVPKNPKGRFERAGFFTTASAIPTDLTVGEDSAQNAEAVVQVWAGASSAVSPRFIEHAKAHAAPSEWVAAAVPVTLGNGAVAGIVHVQQPRFEFRHILASGALTTLVGLAALGGICPTVLIFIWQARCISRRLRTLMDGVVALRQGQWAHRLPEGGADEIGAAVRLFNESMEQLQKDDLEKQQIIQDTINAQKLAQSGMEAKANFLASMSHEIRTPMNGIIGTTSLLLETKLDSEQKEFVRMIHSSGESLLHLINDILDFSKLDSSKMEFEQIPVNLEHLFQETMSVFAYSAAEKGIELNQHVSESLPPNITGDFHRIKQVLVNLIGNAIKFTQQGEILVLAQPVMRQHGQNGEMPWLHVSVRDTGIGIPPEKLSQLFRAFTQADTSTTREFGGTGLGLAISKKLCQLMGGDISVTSEPGVGSNFFLEIPLRAAPQDTADLEAERARLATVRGLRAAILSPNPTTAGIVQHYCTYWGMTAEVVPLHSASAYQDSAALQADVIILDAAAAMLPASVGIAAAAREHGKPMTLLAPLGQEQMKQALITRAGQGAAFLPKPVGRTELLKAVVASIAGARAVRENPAAVRQVAAPVGAAVTLGESHPARVLLVEDQPLNQKLTRMMLDKLGYKQVELAENGREAVEKVNTEKYDLVLMDLHMPVMGGEEATREIRGNFLLKHQPHIIAVTGHAITGVRESCRDAGMDDFLTKPVSLDELRETISRNLRSAQVATLRVA